jgi:hypothetical protein
VGNGIESGGKVMRATVIIIAVLWLSQAIAAPPSTQGLDTSSVEAHGLFTEVLRAYVNDGRVGYDELCRDRRLDEYLSLLANTDPASIIDDRERLAFWINVYNAYTLEIICDNFPVESINDIHFGGLIIGTVLNKTAWDKKVVVVGGEKYSLNHVEHKIIRPEFDDPRAHFAVVCASKSCPPLRAEAFEGVTLDEYKKDFGDNDKEVLLYVAQFLPERVAEAIRTEAESWDVKHTKYDWSLND